MDPLVTVEAEPVPPSGLLKPLLIALLCVIYLLNLSGGWIEVPDCLPVIGNLDELAATVVLMRCLAKLGWQVLPVQGQ